MAQPDSATTLPARALAGVRGLLIDLDGVLVLRGTPIAGAGGALTSLRAAGVPFAIVTNTSLVSRQTLARQMTAAGVPLDPNRILTAASATASYVRRRFPDEPLFVLATGDTLAEFEGLHLLSHDDAAAPGSKAAAVVVGDASEDFNARNMRSAFRLLRGGARFVAMHKNRWWLTPDGETLDAGGYVVALEYAAQRRALVMGKPSEAFFREGLRMLSEQAGEPLRPDEVAMVGDDVGTDIAGGRKAGLRTAFVRSGKHGDAELAGVRGRGIEPDLVAPSIADVVSALRG